MLQRLRKNGEGEAESAIRLPRKVAGRGATYTQSMKPLPRPQADPAAFRRERRAQLRGLLWLALAVLLLLLWRARPLLLFHSGWWRF